jgi:hypothetical protein
MDALAERLESRTDNTPRRCNTDVSLGAAFASA